MAMKGAKRMQFTIINECTDPQVSQSVLEQIAAAVEDQLYTHYAIAHQSDGIPVRVGTDIKSTTPSEAVIAVLNSSDQAGALGYHSVSPAGRPYLRVFWFPIRDNGGSLIATANSLSTCVSHEAVETAGDPYINAWVDIGDGATEEARELCDRVENDSYVMPGHSVAVSNFLTPRGLRPGRGPFDYMQLLSQPFEIRPGGYAIRRTGGPQGDVKQVFGEAYPEWKKLLKSHPASRTSKRHSLYKRYVSYDESPASE